MDLVVPTFKRKQKRRREEWMRHEEFDSFIVTSKKGDEKNFQFDSFFLNVTERI